MACSPKTTCSFGGGGVLVVGPQIPRRPSWNSKLASLRRFGSEAEQQHALSSMTGELGLGSKPIKVSQTPGTMRGIRSLLRTESVEISHSKTDAQGISSSSLCLVEELVFISPCKGPFLLSKMFRFKFYVDMLTKKRLPLCKYVRTGFV